MPPAGFSNPFWPSDFSWGNDVRVRSMANRMSALATLLYGAPNFFSRRAVPPLVQPAERPDAVSYYDTSPLRCTLERLVDFERINSIPMKLSVGATNLRTGAPVYFDNLDRRLTIAHVMASAALPPGFPPVEIDGEYYWDGGVVSNSPIQHVAASRPRYCALAFQVDLWDANGELPLDITSANLRAMEIHSASRIQMSLEQFRSEQKFYDAIGKLLNQLPEDRRNDPQIKMLIEEAHAQRVSVVHLKYQAKAYETTSKIFEFSRRAMQDHWQAGYDDTCAALNEPGVLELPDPLEAVRIYDVHNGWVR
jgi:NTE family protein